MLNGSDFEWHSKAEQPGHSKSDQIAASWITIYWFSLQMLGTAVSMFPVIPTPNHPKPKHQNIPISNVF